jgi:hypothetical protein
MGILDKNGFAKKQRFLEASLTNFWAAFGVLIKTSLLDCANNSQEQPKRSDISLLVSISILIIITMTLSGT